MDEHKDRYGQDESSDGVAPGGAEEDGQNDEALDTEIIDGDDDDISFNVSCDSPRVESSPCIFPPGTDATDYEASVAAAPWIPTAGEMLPGDDSTFGFSHATLNDFFFEWEYLAGEPPPGHHPPPQAAGFDGTLLFPAPQPPPLDGIVVAESRHHPEAEIATFISRHYPGLEAAHVWLIVGWLVGASLGERVERSGESSNIMSMRARISELVRFVVTEGGGGERRLLLPSSTDPNVQAAMAALLEEHHRQTQVQPSESDVPDAPNPDGRSEQTVVARGSVHPYRRQVKSGNDRQTHRCKVCDLPKVTLRRLADGSLQKIAHQCPDEIFQDGIWKVKTAVKDAGNDPIEEAELDRDPSPDQRVLIPRGVPEEPDRNAGNAEGRETPHRHVKRTAPRFPASTSEESEHIDENSDDRKPAAKWRRYSHGGGDDDDDEEEEDGRPMRTAFNDRKPAAKRRRDSLDAGNEASDDEDEADTGDEEVEEDGNDGSPILGDGGNGEEDDYDDDENGDDEEEDAANVGLVAV